eukprot:TRINITY_DN14683_c0_g1_i4.p2 TRINITY_DN14683_c0_g1~~TRINITY_DN14683_c0_g1_i4.p2  ORF type:complete len:178 (-),score=26.63 TRINITY_DN14683_c0_g1_i4:337-870(-)
MLCKLYKATRFQRSAENVERLVWKECDMAGSQTSQSPIILNQQNNNIINTSSTSKRNSASILWWIVVPFVAFFAIFLVTFVWWKNKQNKKRELLENVDSSSVDENENARFVLNSDDRQNLTQIDFQQILLNNNNDQESQNEIQIEDQDNNLQGLKQENEQINFASYTREQELAKIGL